MNKKLITVLTLLLVMTVSVPAMARSFVDVPTHHWAYDSIKQVAEAGIIKGFSDGTYLGDQPLNRYQMASITAGLLEEIDTNNAEVTEDMMAVISKLATEFDNELEKVNQQLAKEDILTILGEAGVKYHVMDVSGADAYSNPFDFDADDPELIADEDYFKQYADLGLVIDQAGLKAEFEFTAIGDYFGNFTDQDQALNNFVVEDISGRLETDDFTATIANDQDLGWKDYLYADKENIDGVILTAENSTFALGKRGDTRNIAASYSNFFKLPITAYLGMEDEADDRNVVVGAASDINLNGINLRTDFAVNDGLDKGQLLKLGAGTDLGLISLDGNYKYANQFVGIQVDDDFAGDVSGYDLTVGSQLDKLELAVKYEDYDGNETTLTAEVNEETPYSLFSFNLFGNYEHKFNADEQIAYFEANKDLGDISLAGFYDYDDSEAKADKVLSLAYAPELEVIGVRLAPEFKLAAIYDIDNEQHLNKEAGVKASYDLNERVAVNSGLTWAEKEARADLTGRLATAQAGIEYKINEDTSANLNYQRTNFHGEDSANNYNAEGVSGGVNIKF